MQYLFPVSRSPSSLWRTQRQRFLLKKRSKTTCLTLDEARKFRLSRNRPMDAEDYVLVSPIRQYRQTLLPARLRTVHL